jgi:hypothetical protein
MCADKRSLKEIYRSLRTRVLCGHVTLAEYELYEKMRQEKARRDRRCWAKRAIKVSGQRKAERDLMADRAVSGNLTAQDHKRIEGLKESGRLYMARKRATQAVNRPRLDAGASRRQRAIRMVLNIARVR